MQMVFDECIFQSKSTQASWVHRLKKSVTHSEQQQTIWLGKSNDTPILHARRLINHSVPLSSIPALMTLDCIYSQLACDFQDDVSIRKQSRLSPDLILSDSHKHMDSVSHEPKMIRISLKSCFIVDLCFWIKRSGSRRDLWPALGEAERPDGCDGAWAAPEAQTRRKRDVAPLLLITLSQRERNTDARVNLADLVYERDTPW